MKLLLTSLFCLLFSLYLGDMSGKNNGLKGYLMLRFIHKYDGSIGVSRSDILTKCGKHPYNTVILDRLEEFGYVEKRYYSASRKSADTFYLTTEEGNNWLISGALTTFGWKAFKVLGMLLAMTVAIIAIVKFTK